MTKSRLEPSEKISGLPIPKSYKPAVNLWGASLTRLIFEQELHLESLYFMLNKYIEKSLLEGDLEIN